MTNSMIKKLCYELYKIDWKRKHISADIEMDNIKDYYEGLVDGDIDYTYEDYLFEFGYNGELYACYEEFLEKEYLNMSYMIELLNNDKLIRVYFDDAIDTAIAQEKDKLWTS